MPVRTYEHFAARDQLTAVVMERMLAGVSTRRYRRVQEPVGEQVEQSARSTSKSAVSRSFVARTKEALIELMARPLADVRLAVLMIDGVGLKDHTCVVALGITTDGVKIPLGLWDGSTENKTVTSELLSNLVHRGLDVEQGVLVVIDGSKALRAAVNDVLGTPHPGPALPDPQGAQRPRSPRRPRPRSRQAPAAPGVGGDRPRHGRSSSSPRSPQSSSAPIPAPPRRCARGWPRRSPSPA